ncbi:MAG: hypothetical protein ACREIW_05645 [Chthoniobacterales bacterium]
MTKRILQFTSALVVGCFLLPGCAYFSKTGRQEMAYERYVKKCQKRRYHQRVKITKQQQEIPTRPAPKYEVKVGRVNARDATPMSESSGEPQQ